jgi:hypothetical protein
MPTFLKDMCYLHATTYAACIEFHTDEHHRRAFNAGQLIEFSLEPNPDADDDKNLPPQKLSLAFSTADVVVLGWRLGLIADYLRDNQLSAICILPKRYAELERNSAFVSAITITAVSK